MRSVPQPSPAPRLAADAGVSLEAVALLRVSEVVDLHLETYLQQRIFRTDLARRQGRGWLGGRLFGHLDLPRALDGGLTGAMWSLATNVALPAGRRWRLLQRQLDELDALLEGFAGGGAIAVCRTHADFLRARSAGQHGALLAVQGGNACVAAPEDADLSFDGRLTRVTVMHLTDSAYGATSSPFGLRRGLTRRGRAFVERLNAARIFVDLAHIDRKGFFDALDVHAEDLPPIVTHTGVSGVRPHWRNLDDVQIRAIADRGGVIGVMFAPPFLRGPGRPDDLSMVLDHLEHIERVGGEGVAALGSDYDGFITPSPDLRDGRLAYARLVQGMLDRRWSPERIQGVLGESFLASWARLRPGASTAGG
jgi:membrane dipeptidase